MQVRTKQIDIINMIKVIEMDISDVVNDGLKAHLRNEFGLIYDADLSQRGGYFDYNYALELLHKMQEINQSYKISVSLSQHKDELYFNFTDK
jgi:hypothetical protein